MPKMKSIPDWYAADWTPARGRWEFPPMTWDAVEMVIASSALPPARKDLAMSLYRALWLESAILAPLDLLQRFLIVTAAAFDPGRARPSRTTSAIPTTATGLLPRWSFTDLEVALSYTWSGTALFLATERHHDLLERRGEALSAKAAVRQVMLLVSGLPVPEIAISGPKHLRMTERAQVAA